VSLSSYLDILERVAERPSWWWQGVPRYGPFHPSRVTSGPGEVLLVAAACQACGHEDLICATGPGNHWTFRDRIDVAASIGVGNAPFECCSYGHIFSLSERKVEEFWTWQGNDWVRQSGLEQPLLENKVTHVLCLEEKLKLAGGYIEWETSRAALDIDSLVALLPQLGLPEERVDQIARNWWAVVRDIDEMFQPEYAIRKKLEFFTRGFPCEPWCVA